jgi:hypothetical protein
VGVNLDHLTAFSKFNPNFLLLPDPISYLLSELLLSLRRFLDLWEAFLRVFSNLSNFLLNSANDSFAGLGFLPAFLAARKIGFCHPVFLILAAVFGSVRSMRVPMFLAQLARLLKTDFLVSLLCGTLLGCLAPASFL